MQGCWPPCAWHGGLLCAVSVFTTGLGTNLKELIKAGPIATLVACVGVAVPLVGGTLLYSAFYGFSAVGSPEFYRALFIGTIISVAGKLTSAGSI